MNFLSKLFKSKTTSYTRPGAVAAYKPTPAKSPSTDSGKFGTQSMMDRILRNAKAKRNTIPTYMKKPLSKLIK